MNLRVDDSRFKKFGETGIFVRAQNTSGVWSAFDLADLSKESLLEWLRSRGGDNKWAEDTVGILLGHGHLHSQTESQAKSKEEK